MRKLALVAVVLLFAIVPDIGRSHPDHGTVEVFVHSAQNDPRASDKRVMLELIIVNATGNAATLRGLRLEGHGPVAIERLRGVLGLTLWQPVRFLRLEAGERIDLFAPDYRIAIPMDVWQNSKRKLYADFGPLGENLIYDPVSDGPQTTL